LVLKILENILIALVPVLIVSALLMFFLPHLMFNYVIPIEKEVIKTHKEEKN